MKYRRKWGKYQEKYYKEILLTKYTSLLSIWNKNQKYYNNRLYDSIIYATNKEGMKLYDILLKRSLRTHKKVKVPVKGFEKLADIINIPESLKQSNFLYAGGLGAGKSYYLNAAFEDESNDICIHCNEPITYEVRDTLFMHKSGRWKGDNGYYCYEGNYRLHAEPAKYMKIKEMLNNGTPVTGVKFNKVEVANKDLFLNELDKHRYFPTVEYPKEIVKYEKKQRKLRKKASINKKVLQGKI